MKVGRPAGIKQPQSFCDNLSKIWKGVPKPEEQKKKMSEASSGKPKSAEHKASMSISQTIRAGRVREIMKTHNVNRSMANKIYKAQK
jgi:hypothetical protein